MNEPDELSELCRSVGSDVLMVQGGGGNGSVKSADGKTMWVKASGFRMSEVSPTSGFAKIETDGMSAIVRDPALPALPVDEAHAECVRRTNDLTPNGPRPSMETGFHSLLGRVVLHTHCVQINAFACVSGGEELLRASIDEPFLWIPYVTPGYVLSREIDRDIARHGQSGAIVLANHGFIASGSSVEEALAITGRFVRASSSVFGEPLPASSRTDPHDGELENWAEGLRFALGGVESPLKIRVLTAPALRLATNHESDFRACLIPDDAIYTGMNVATCNIVDQPAKWLQETGYGAEQRFVASVERRGAVLAGPGKSLQAMEESVVASALLRELALRRGELTYIPEAECRYLLSMESEKYRQAVSAGTVDIPAV